MDRGWRYGEFNGRSVDDLSPSLIDFTAGGSFGYNVTSQWGVEGEFAGIIGIEQDIDVDTDGDGVFDAERTSDTPNLLTYNGNVLYHFPATARVVPYGTFGVGAMTMLEDEELGIPESRTDFAINYSERLYGGLNIHF